MTTAAFNPFAGAFGNPAAFMPDFQTFMSRMAAMPRVMEIARGVRVGTTPHVVTHREGQLQVLHYESDAKRRYRTPLLIAFALVNRPYILDLMPHKSVVRKFLDRGFDVFLIDWGVPTANDKHLTIEHYVEGCMHNVVNHVREFTGEDQISLMGYCMGGTMGAMYTSLHQELIKNFMLMAAPIDWSDRESLLSVWTDEKNLDIDKMIDTYGNAPAQWLQGSFAMLKPVTNYIEKYIGFQERMTDEKFVEEYFAMETWANDNIPVAGETFRQFVKDCFQRNLLVQGKMRLGKKRIDLGNITCPILNLMAEKDHLVPCGQSMPFNDLVGSKDRKAITFPAGHIGLAVGSKAQRDLWPRVCDWLGDHSNKA